MKRILLLLVLFVATITINAQENEETMTAEELQTMLKSLDSINKTFTYQHGTIQLGDKLATLNVPKGFKYLDAAQSKRVLEELWGNPPQETLGLLFHEDEDPSGINLSYAVEIQYSDEGYISDKDAKKIDYDELLKDMQKDIKETNPERIKQGYPSMELVSWAAKPYYNAETKKLFWAKEIRFDGEETNTLNYNIRVLGRQGYLMLNAIGDMDVLDKFEKEKDVILESVSFNDGSKYSDFDSGTDKIAAYGIGGLIAGKVLAKVGFFAVILKFGKIIFLAIAAFFGKFRKRIFGSKKKDEGLIVRNDDTDV